MMINPSAVNRTPVTSPVDARAGASLPPTKYPAARDTITTTREASSTRDPSSDTIVLQFTAIPAISARPSARFATFTSSGCHALACSA
jgi:hypothetical protein